MPARTTELSLWRIKFKLDRRSSAVVWRN